MYILTAYVDEVLTPSKRQIKFMKAKVRSIIEVLANCSSIKPKEVHLGGSMAKGTMLSHKLDADIIFLYNKIEEFGKDWNKLVTSVYKPLKDNFPEIAVEEAGNLAIHLKDTLDEKEVNFDVVPGYFVNSPKTMEDHVGSNLYTANTTVWHSRYLQKYKDYTYFRHIIRLLKDWKNEQDVPFLKSLHFELTAADVYDNILPEIDYPVELDEVLMYCFKNIIDTLDGYPVIPFEWKYCNEEDFEERYENPVLIDPANPRDNLLSKITKIDINKIRKKTMITMENLQEGYYADIFNRKGFTDFFE